MAGCRSLLSRAQALVTVLVLVTLGGLASANPAAASSDPPFPINESFSNTTAPGWTFGGSATLTAPGTDTAGNGWLRLTSATGNQFGYGFYDTPFSSTKGAQVEFDYATYGGTGADGLTFFLYDGATTAAQFTPGQAGGSLGYACNGSNPGLKNAYIGVGLDEYGNFGNPATCGSGTSTLYPNYVVVRGSEANGYPILTKAATTQALTASRANARHVQIAVTPDKKLSVYIKYPDGTYQTVVSGYQLPASIPSTLKLGYVGSTGGSTNYHEIRNTSVVKPTDITTTVTDGATGSSRAAAKTWTAVVTNTGPNDTNSGSFKATSTQSLTNISWTCSASAGSSCGAATSGTGLPDIATGAMAVNGTLTFQITGTPAAATDYAQLTVNAQPTGDVGDADPTDNAASDSTDLTPVFDTNPTFTLAANGTATATTKTARGGSMAYTYAWERCDPDGTNCAAISGATATTYTTTTADRGKTIRFRETGTNAAGATPAYSAVYGPLPDTTITSNPASATTATSASFAFSTATSGATYECSLDGAAYAACTSPKTYSALAQGSHTFTVRAVYGGLSDDTPASYTWTVDTTAPDTSITAQPAAVTNATAAALAFTGTDGSGSGVASFQCSLDGAAYGACASPQSYTGLAQGSHTFTVRAIDNAGNTDASPASYTWTVDTTAPDTSIGTKPAAASNTAAPSFSFSGTDTGGGSVASYECRVDGGAWAACTSPKALSGLADGSHTFSVRAIDTAGNTDASPASYTWTVDTGAPDTSITAKPNAGTTATSATFSFSGTDAGGTGVASYECQLDGGAYTACTSSKTYTGLAEGAHTFNVRAIDTAGNPDPTPATYTWNVDNTAPDTTITAKPPANVNLTAANFAFSGSDPGGSGVASFQCALDGAAFTACASPAGYTILADGSHTFQVRALDAAGNIDATPASYTWTVDTTAPDTVITAKPSAASSSTTANFTFNGTDGGSGVASLECSLDGAAYAACTSPRSYTGLAEGSHTLSARAIDNAGNTDGSPATYTWTVDTTAPDTTITAKPNANSASTSASFSFTGTDPGGSGGLTYACSLDGAAFTACTSPSSLTGLAQGSHTYAVRAIDAAGNVDASPASYTWNIDTTAPDTTISSGPAAQTSATSASIAFSGTDSGGAGVASYECQLDGGTWAACTSPKTYTGLADGSHTVKVRAIDGANNVDASPAIRTWVIDTAPPDTTIASTPAGASASTSATFSFTGTDAGTGVASYECQLDGGTWTACTAPKTYTNLAEGSHTFKVRAIDGTGAVDPTPDTFTWTVDTTKPSTAITSSPTQPGDPNPTITFTGSDPGGSGVASFECQLDGGAWVACSSPKSYPGLPDGVHTVAVRAVDQAGNRDPAPATVTFTTDNTAPDTTFAQKPASATTDGTAMFSFTGTDGSGSGVASFECRLDGGAWAACTSPTTLSGLAEGSHTYEVRAIDNAGNHDATPATYTWSVDRTPPTTSLDNGPVNPSNTASPSFTFSGSDPGGSGVASYECQLDGGTWTACTSPKTFTGLPDGTHTFKVRAIDGAGNTDPSPKTETWVIDTVAPDTAIGTKPPAASASATATFGFTGTDGSGTGVASYECQLDGGSWTVCTAPKTFTGLPDGTHTVKVRAIDGAGNVDASPASYTWAVNTGTPSTTIAQHPPAASASSSAEFTFSGTSPGGVTFECRLDGGAWTTCTSPRTLTGLPDGTHTFEVRSVNNAGTPDPTPQVFTWTVDTVGPASTPAAASPTAERRPTITVTSDPNTQVEVSVDGTVIATVTTDASGKATFSSPVDIADGTHTLTTVGIDPVGNRGPAGTTTLKVSATAPSGPAITQAPASTSSDPSPQFAFTGTPGSTFECSLDGGAFTPCSATPTFPNLPDGTHTLKVREVNDAGVKSADRDYTWTVSTSKPSTPAYVTKPAPSTTDTGARFDLKSDPGTTLKCSVDGGAPVDCTRGLDLSELAVGAHTIKAQSFDPSGNASDIATYAWTIGKGGVKLTARLVTNPVIHANRRMTLLCRPSLGTLKTCVGKAYARIGKKLVVIAQGTRTINKVGVKSLGVRVRLTKQGYAALKARPNGLKVSLSMKAATREGRDLSTRVKLMIYPTRKAAHFVLSPVSSAGDFTTGARKADVARIAKDIKRAKSILCVGHTDGTKTGAAGLKTGEAWATAACNALKKRIGNAKVKLTVQTKGSTAPRATNQTAKGRSLNRRVVLLVRFP